MLPYPATVSDRMPDGWRRIAVWSRLICAKQRERHAMARNSRATIARQKDANTGAVREELTVQGQEIDTPVLPVDQLEQLHRFRPDIVDWVLHQTEKEADFRRNRQNKVDSYIRWEILIGQIFGLAIGIAGIIGGAVVAISGHPGAGGTIASISIGTLAVAFIGKMNKK